MWAYLTTFYAGGAELAAAWGFIGAAQPLAQVLGGPIASALLYADGFLGLRGYQWLFLLVNYHSQRPESISSNIFGSTLPSMPVSLKILFAMPCIYQLYWEDYPAVLSLEHTISKVQKRGHRMALSHIYGMCSVRLQSQKICILSTSLWLSGQQNIARRGHTLHLHISEI